MVDKIVDVIYALSWWTIFSHEKILKKLICILLYIIFFVQYFFRMVLNVMVYFWIVKLNDKYDNVLDLHH